MKLYLVRHTSVNVPFGTCYGHTNVPLKETFEAEAEVVKSELSDKTFDIVYSSPLGRCRKLAKYCMGEQHVVYMDRLKEMHMGDWEMTMWNELDAPTCKEDWVTTPAPNGESFEQMYNRVASFFDELKTKDYKNAILFTHGGVICCAKVYFDKADIKETYNLMPEYGEVLEFEL